jgi:hypothetical protein
MHGAKYIKSPKVGGPRNQAVQLVILIVVASCTTQPGKNHVADNVNAAQADLQCHSAQRTGTMLSKTVCTTRTERNAQQAADEELRKALAAQPHDCRSDCGVSP